MDPTGKKRVPNKYMRTKLNNLDKIEGNVDSLTNKIANVRTWSYVSNKKNWVENIRNEFPLDLQNKMRLLDLRKERARFDNALIVMQK